MVNESECFLLWAIPTFGQWGECRGRVAHRHRPGALAEAQPTTSRTHQHRFLLVDSPLSPMRTGRQPAREDREPGWDDL